MILRIILTLIVVFCITVITVIGWVAIFLNFLFWNHRALKYLGPNGNWRPEQIYDIYAEGLEWVWKDCGK